MKRFIQFAKECGVNLELHKTVDRLNEKLLRGRVRETDAKRYAKLTLKLSRQFSVEANKVSGFASV